MIPLARSLDRYLEETFGLPVALQPWPQADDLPRILRERYAFHRLRVADQVWLAALDRERQPLDTPAAIRKQLTLVAQEVDHPVILVSNRIAAHNRKRLIGQRQAFVVPGSQVYLPEMGVVFQEHYRPATAPPETLAPATQAVLLSALYRPELLVGTQASTAAELGYSKMTLSRAHEELVRVGLIAPDDMTAGSTGGGWSRSREDVWRAALPFLRSPVRRRRGLTVDPDRALAQWPAAGASALRRLTDVVGDRQPTIAMSQRQWSECTRQPDRTRTAGVRHREAQPAETGIGDGLLETTLDDPEAVMVEIWSYPPLDWGRRDTVDPLSLLLCYREDPDERLQTAIEDLEGLVW